MDPLKIQTDLEWFINHAQEIYDLNAEIGDLDISQPNIILNNQSSVEDLQTMINYRKQLDKLNLLQSKVDLKVYCYEQHLRDFKDSVPKLFEAIRELPWEPDSLMSHPQIFVLSCESNVDTVVEDFKELLYDQFDLEPKFVSTICGFLREAYTRPMPPKSQDSGFKSALFLVSFTYLKYHT